MPDRDTLKAAGEDLVRRISAAMEQINWTDVMEFAHQLPRVRRTFLTGAGRSGLVARSFGMRLLHAGLPAFIPGDTITPAAGEGDLLVAISCTGSTGITDYITRRAREFGAKIVVITANDDSPLADRADTVLKIPVSAENIVLRAAIFEHTASLCLDAVFNVLADQLKLDLDTYRQRHANLE